MADNDIKKTFGRNLTKLLSISGETQAELAEKMHVAPSSVSGWCTGTKMPRMDKVEWLCTHFGVTRSNLIEDSSASAGIPKGFIPMPEMRKIPLVGSIACGTPILAEENIQDYVDIPRHIRADYALTCEGDSMIGAGIRDGDVVYIRKQAIVESGQIAAVRIDDEATLKRFYRKGNTVTLVAENPSFEPLMFIGEEINDIAIEGLAVAYTHKLVK